MKRLAAKPARKASRTLKTGLPPGSLVHVGERKADKVAITIYDYTHDVVEEKIAASVEECFPYLERPTVTWINIDGLHDVHVVQQLGNHYGVHPLVLEDVLNTTQRPKIVEYDNFIFLVVKMLHTLPGSGELHAEQVSVILGRNFVLSFQESSGEVFDAVRDRIKGGKGRIRKFGPDYLAYTLLDAIVDNYFPVLDRIEEAVEDLEEQLISRAEPDALQRIHRLKKEVLFIRKFILPLREVIVSLEKEEFDLVHENTNLFLRDLYDHAIQAMDTIEQLREALTSMVDTHLSAATFRMNEVITVLTMMASIFIPLTFVAGIYGMNFEYMPELKWRYGYPFAILLMAVVAVSLYFFFRRKGWVK